MNENQSHFHLDTTNKELNKKTFDYKTQSAPNASLGNESKAVNKNTDGPSAIGLSNQKEEMKQKIAEENENLLKIMPASNMLILDKINLQKKNEDSYSRLEHHTLTTLDKKNVASRTQSHIDNNAGAIADPAPTSFADLPLGRIETENDVIANWSSAESNSIYINEEQKSVPESPTDPNSQDLFPSFHINSNELDDSHDKQASIVTKLPKTKENLDLLYLTQTPVSAALYEKRNQNVETTYNPSLQSSSNSQGNDFRSTNKKPQSI